MSEPTRNVVEPTTNSATDKLRALLDERGVEYRWDNGTATWYVNDVMYNAWGYDSERLTMSVCHLTPEQAIDATLGRGTCRDVRSEDATIAFECSECGCWVAYDEYWETGIYIQGEGQQAHIHPHYCPNCGRAVMG